MPTIFYTAEEYDRLLNEKQDLERKVDALETLRPAWAHGGPQVTAIALAQLWKLLGVTNQTAAMQTLRDLVHQGRQ